MGFPISSREFPQKKVGHLEPLPITYYPLSCTTEIKEERIIRLAVDHAADNDERCWIQCQGFTNIFLHFYFPPSSYLRILLLLSYLLCITM